MEEELFDVADGYRPLIAVARPGRPIAQRGALAYRTHLTNSEWQEYVVDKIRRAESIVIVLRNTDGVRWELSKVLAEGAASKTLFLFDPAAKDAEVWGSVAEAFLPQFEAAGLITPGLAFGGRPMGFYFAEGELVIIENAHWSATSYRTAFSHFLSARARRLGNI